MGQLQILGSGLMILSQLLSFVFPAVFAVDADCNYYQNMEIGPTYYVYNREYPEFYGKNQNCLWTAVAPRGYAVEATCQLELPGSTNCVDDRVLISTNGDPNLVNAHVYCGYGNQTVISESTTLTIGLQSSYQSTGGRFLCSLKAKAADPPPCNCGWKNMRRIVGGVETKVNEYPMMAALIDFGQRELFCGATIIATTYVLTAAHCLTRKTPPGVGVLVGDHNITSGTETNMAVLLYTTRFIVHPQYNPSNTNAGYDVAVVQTDRAIQYNWAVGPVCLPFAYYQYSFAYQTVNALGWGTTEFTGPASEVLLETDLEVLDYGECNIRGNGTADQLCTYRAGHDACQKDSGGPILWYDNNSGRTFIVGIISSGFACASTKPGINTRVTSFLMWIASVTPDADYCIKGTYDTKS